MLIIYFLSQFYLKDPDVDGKQADRALAADKSQGGLHRQEQGLRTPQQRLKLVVAVGGSGDASARASPSGPGIWTDSLPTPAPCVKLG
jgi:hypothetical protein